MNHEERILELVDGYCSGSLSDEEFRELEEELRRDPELRSELIRSRILDADLRTSVSAVAEPSGVPSSGDPGKTILRLRIEVVALAAAVAILLAGFSFLRWSEKDGSNSRGSLPDMDKGVAVLTRAFSAEWADRSVRPGDSLAPGNWQLVSGKAEIEFYSGASVILQAPADLEIQSEHGGILHHGKLRADVPKHAHGFTIDTKAVRLVDLGTSFGIEVGPEETAAIHVFDGSVELFDPGLSSGGKVSGEELVAGEGRLIELNGDRASIEVDESSFLNADDLEVASSARFEAWRRASSENLQDSRLIAAYHFEPRSGSSRVLPQLALSEPDSYEGAIIGARWSEGRWKGKGALDFKRPSDRVRIDVPSSQVSVTLIAWLRVDGFDNSFHSILLSDGWDRPGALHWQIHRDGYIELAVWCYENTRLNNSRAPFEMSASDFGRWMQLAVVYDGENGTVTHYRDGIASASIPLSRVVPISIESAEIGNWKPPGGSRQIRHFNGRIDEILIFEEVLSSDEILRLYGEGTP